MLLERETNISPRVFLLPPVVFGTPPRHRARSPAVGHDVPALAEFTRQANHQLPAIRLRKDAGKVWLEKLKDETVDLSLRKSMEKQFEMQVELEIDSAIRSWKQALYESRADVIRDRMKSGFVGVDWDTPEMLRIISARDRALAILAKGK